MTERVNGEGLIFSRDLQLQAGDSRQLTLEIKRGATQQKVAPLSLRLEMMPHPSTPTIKQSLSLRVTENAG